MTRALRSLGLVAFALLVSKAASAQIPVADLSSKLRLGANLVPMPFGSTKFDLGALGEAKGDTAFAFGIMPAADYSINQYFFVGFAPQITFNIKGKDSDGDAGKMLDLLLRVGGNAPVADAIQLYGYAAPGYSWVIPPEGDSSKGFVVGFHGGVIFDLSPTMFLNGEIGYQLGYQSLHDLDYKLNYFQIGLGAGARL